MNCHYFCLFLSVILLLIKYKTSEHKKVQDKLSAAIKISLWNSSFPMGTQFIATLKCMKPKQSVCKEKLVLLEPRCEKTGLRGFRPGHTQTGLYRHRR